MLINDYIKRHAENLNDNQIHMIRIVQAGILIGVVFLYKYMLGKRAKIYGKKKDR